MRTLCASLKLLPEIPWEDGWKTAILLGTYGKLTLSDLFAQHNEHRILLTHLVDLADLYIFGGRNLFHFAVTVIATAAQAAAIGWLATYKIGCTHSERIALYSLAFGTLFSLPQIELFFWSFAVGNVLSSLFVILTLAILSRAHEYRSLTLMSYAVAAGILAVFGLASGLLVWPIGLLALLACERKFTGKSLIWLITGGLAYLLYFHNYVSPPYHADPRQALMQHPADLLAFFLIVIGSLAGGHGVAIAAAAGGAAATWMGSAFIAYAEAFAKSPRNITALLGITIFSCLSAAAAASSRINFGLEHALSSRYTVLSALSFACIFATNFALRNRPAENRTHERIRTPIIALCALAVIFYLPSREIDRFADASAKMGATSIAIALHIDDAQQTPWNPSFHPFILNALGFFEKQRLSVFHGDRYRVGQALSDRFRPVRATRCSGHVDAVDAVAVSPDSLRVAGWAWLNDTHDLPDRIVLTDGSQRIVGWAAEGWLRPDVPKTLTRSRRSGWVGYARAAPGTTLQAFAVNTSKGTACSLR
ncbi:MAG: hypothetical protein PHT19_16370 [Methylococcus sp.]|nr:hypothetical protein [Methylococcus sp.]